MSFILLCWDYNGLYKLTIIITDKITEGHSVVTIDKFGILDNYSVAVSQKRNDHSLLLLNP